MKDVVSLDEFRKNLSHIVGRVMYGNQTVLVQKHNKVGVIVMSEREYENLKDPRKRFASKEDWDELFVLTDKIRGRMSTKDQEALANVLDKEIKAVRVQKQHSVA